MSASDRTNYQIHFAPETDAEFKRIGHAAARRILEAILKKLTDEPDRYGDPLRKDLSGYRKLRVGQYRVVYHVEGANARVLILAVGKRAATDRENIYDQISQGELADRQQRLEEMIEEE